MRKGVDEGVCSGIAALPGRTQKRSERRKQYEKIEAAILRQFVQPPGAKNLWICNRSKALSRRLQQDAVVEDRGRVDDSAKRRHRRIDVFEHFSHAAFICNVG